MIKINGVEFEYDLYDLESAEKVKKELERAAFALEHPPKNLDRIKMIKLTVKVVGDCLNNLFGKGAANKVFKGKTNMGLAMQAFKELSLGLRKEDEQFVKNIEDDIKEFRKFSPKRIEHNYNKNNKFNKRR
ncbi:hypothetical protein PTL64_14805 [Clostridium perfringens]|nr:hypothetical protein [Clostridium perfringens]